MVCFTWQFMTPHSTHVAIRSLMSGSMTRSSGTWRGSVPSPINESTPAPMDWMAFRLWH